MNRWQAAFVEWNAQRLGITEQRSRERFERSNAVLAGGHGGAAFREFMHVSPDLSALRGFLREHGYEEIRPNTLYRKP